MSVFECSTKFDMSNLGRKTPCPIRSLLSYIHPKLSFLYAKQGRPRFDMSNFVEPWRTPERARSIRSTPTPDELRKALHGAADDRPTETDEEASTR